MNIITLNTKDRTNDGDSIPGVVYGPEMKQNAHIAVEYNELNKVLNEAGSNKIVQLKASGQDHDHEALFKDVQYDPVTNRVIHFDMYAIKRGQKIKAEIPVVLVGEAPAVLRGATLTQVIDEIEVECIPSKLPESFEIDVSGLEEIGNSISTDDIPKDEDVELLVEEHLTIAKIEEVHELKVEDEGPVDGPSDEEGEEVEGEDAAEGEASEDGENSEGEESSDDSSDEKSE